MGNFQPYSSSSGRDRRFSRQIQKGCQQNKRDTCYDCNSNYIIFCTDLPTICFGNALEDKSGKLQLSYCCFASKETFVLLTKVENYSATKVSMKKDGFGLLQAKQINGGKI